jgi:hypothetical protein
MPVLLVTTPQVWPVALSPVRSTCENVASGLLIRPRILASAAAIASARQSPLEPEQADSSAQARSSSGRGRMSAPDRGRKLLDLRLQPKQHRQSWFQRGFAKRSFLAPRKWGEVARRGRDGAGDSAGV